MKPAQAYHYSHTFQFSDKIIFLNQIDFILNWKDQKKKSDPHELADLMLPVFSHNI